GQIILDDSPKKVFSQVDKMKKIGLDVPQVTDLAWELNKAGYAISTEIITEQECLTALEKLLLER
ncbi:MAG: energy-coupling factor transporter ATPase, partial [Oscillospiraceae bacterium]|nr:energy-coupling factor transporter ATPase [Oscillospiraceae bacterium]